MRDKTAFACNLYLAQHFHRITALTGQFRKYSDDRSFGVVAERLIDLVTDCKFKSHGEPNPSAHALRRVRHQYGFFAIGKVNDPRAE